MSGVPVVQNADDGKVLTASVSGATKTYSWAAPARELPDQTKASVGDILTITADGPAWVTPEA